MAKEKKVSRINLVESSHHDLGWHKGCYDAEAAFTFDEINTALEHMRRDPNFTWTHECGGYVYRYLEEYPERYEELAKRVAEGRFDIGAGYTMPYTSFVTSEMLVRQFIYGKKWSEKTFPGCKSDVYYNTDVPGLGVQMPQIMAKSDVRYLYASRSWNFDGYHQNEFKQMESLDKSRINVFFMNHYGNFHFDDENGKPIIERTDVISQKVEEFRQDMENKNVGDELPLLYSMDCCLPMDFTERFDKWNAYAEEHNLPKMAYSTLQGALDAVFTENADLSRDVLTGEWPSKWFYENAASDDHTFMNQREAERFLRTTEILAVIRAITTGSFAAYPAEKLEKAWRAADHACHGYAPEGSVEDFKRTYQMAFDTAKEIYDENMTWLVRAIRTDKNKGTAFVVFNNLSWVRDDVIVMDKPANIGDNFVIADASGAEVPWQISDTGDVVFVARAVPAMGYKVYYIRTVEEAAPAKTGFEVGAAWTEPFSNRFYTLTPAVRGGALEAVVDLENGGKSLFSTEKFKIGELYDFQYDGMGAGEQLNMWQPYNGVSQRNYFKKWTCVESGPVRTVFESNAPAAARGPMTLRLSVYEDLKRVDFDVKMDLDDEQARQLRLMFPVNAGEMFGADGMVDQSQVKVSYEVPFGAVNIGDEMLPKFSHFNDNLGDPNFVGGYTTDPATYNRNTAVRPREVQNWVQAGTADFRVNISTYNLGWDYQDPTDNPVRTPVLQPIMISTSKACHWLYGHWLQPGKHAFRFSLTSGAADSTAGHKLCTAVNNPMEARVQDFQTRMLPETDEGFGVSRDNVIITAVKKAEDDDRHVVIRWYEAEGKNDGSDVTIRLPRAEADKACKINLIERVQKSDDTCAENGALTGPVAPWSIETAMVELKNIR